MPKSIRDFYQQQIEELLTSDFERNLLDAALANLEASSVLRFNNFAYALRELLRHVFTAIAPDAEVKNCVWQKGTVTRADRIHYAIQGGLSDAYVMKVLGISVGPVKKRLLKSIKKLNGHTHIQPHSFNISRLDSNKLAKECLDSIVDLIGTIQQCRKLIVDRLEEYLDQHMENHAISETIADIDELASHHSIEEIYVEEISVDSIKSKGIYATATGTISCELQFGSNSDIRNDLGGLVETSFNFTALMLIEYERPLGSIATVEGLRVHTEEWKDNGLDN